MTLPTVIKFLQMNGYQNLVKLHDADVKETHKQYISASSNKFTVL